MECDYVHKKAITCYCSSRISSLRRGGGSSGSTTPDQPSGYDPSLPEQTLTADQLADVSEIVSTTTVTVEDDVKIASDAKDLVVKGNLIIK